MKLNGEYKILYKSPFTRKQDLTSKDIKTFKGKCENFNSGNGLCAFVDVENRMLLVNYHDIVQMKPVKENKS